MRTPYIIILIIILFYSGLQANFENNFFGTRIKGLAGAYVALADDYQTSLQNQAGLAKLDNIGLSFSYTRPYWGYDDEFTLNNYFASLVYPNKVIGTLNFYYSSFNISSLYAENIFSLNYGINLNRFFKKLFFNLDIGYGVKILNKSYTLDMRTENDPVLKDKQSKTGLGMDAGIIASPFISENKNYYKFGLSIINFNQPNMGFMGQDFVYREYNFGFAYYFNNINFFNGSSLIPSVQIQYLNHNTLLITGMEIWILKKMLGIRGGWNKNELSTGMSFRYQIKTKYEINFDYAFSLSNQLIQNYGTHNFSLTFKFLNSLPIQ